MSHADQLRALLRPLGVYDLNAPINGAALDVKGAVLDELALWLEELEQETDLTLARDWGVENWQSLFDLRPASRSIEELRQAIHSLLRIGTGPCSLAAVQDTLSGCGIPTQVEEVGTGLVRVSFPGTAGEPEDFEYLKTNIEAILPAHIGLEYVFRYLTWELLESYKWKFRDMETMAWNELERSV